MKKEDLQKNIDQIEDENSIIKLSSNKSIDNSKHIKSKSHEKIKIKNLSSNLDDIQIFKNNLSEFGNINTFYKFIGKSIALFMDKNDEPILIIGPDWPFVIFLFLIFNFFYIYIIIKFWFIFSVFNKFINQISYWIFIISFLYTSLINQGYPKMNEGRSNEELNDKYYYCGKCQFYINRFNNCFHCNKCGICIEDQEHHCIWIGKCVGKKNITSFYIFCASTIFCSIYIILFLPKLFRN